MPVGVPSLRVGMIIRVPLALPVASDGSGHTQAASATGAMAATDADRTLSALLNVL